MDISVLGIDIAKHVFQLHGANLNGKPVLRKRLRRQQLLHFVSQLHPCVVGIEACGSSNYWAREITKFGHEVRIVSARFVKPYVKSQKNDASDAEAIAEAVSRPTMRFVSPKTAAQQDLQSLHRIRERLIKNRTALSNEIRGLLAEFGIVVPKGINILRKSLSALLIDNADKLSTVGTNMFQELQAELRALDQRIEMLEEKLLRATREFPAFKRLVKVPGVGPLTASAIVSSVSNPRNFRSGRQFSAWLGLVPQQYSTGGKTTLGAIKKKGNEYLRRLLIHGARAVMRFVAGKSDRTSRWASGLKERIGANKATVGLANKNARIIWALLVHDREYLPQGM